MTAAELKLSGLATGLTALVAVLAADRFAVEAQRHLVEQRRQVADRVARFQPVITAVLQALADHDVPATPVKGVELLAGIWPYADARPMADIDVVVPPTLRSQAAAALVSADPHFAGPQFEGASAHEDTFLAWGDGSVGRTDGESADHNGRVELHPGWSEFLHGYVVEGFAVDRHSRPGELGGAPCMRLGRDGVAAHVIGHLGSTVVRCEVRAVNVIDVWFCDRAGVDWDHASRLLDECDARLAGPGLWLCQQLIPGVIPMGIVDRHLHRLPRAAHRRLDGATADETLRDPVSRTTALWRQAFARGSGERAAVLRQMATSKRLRR